ncbi:hypothetical protein FQN53_000475 [Emmonsiellopsis sp. PD_33]|nr:hypothetical protein FQN53_000475 [Emmonsiellopsis sp. PD_33]
MIPSPWLRNPRLVISNGQTLQIRIRAGRALHQRRHASSLVILPFLNHRPSKQCGLQNRDRHFNRNFHNGKEVGFHAQNPLRNDQLKIEISQAELQGDGDIYDYLRIWQEKNDAQNRLGSMQPSGAVLNGGAMKGDMFEDDITTDEQFTDMFDMDEYNYSVDEDRSSTTFLPGDLVLIKSEHSPSDGLLAIYVRSLDKQPQFYTNRGKWLVAPSHLVELIARQIASTDALNVILPYFPTARVERGVLPQMGTEGGVPRPLGAPLVDSMRAFEIAAHNFYRRHLATLDDLYNVLVADGDVPIMTLDEIAQKALKLDPSTLLDSERYAIVKAINRLSFFISSNKVGPYAESYTIRPRVEAIAVSSVLLWTREYQDMKKRLAIGDTILDIEEHPLEQFVQKAQRIIHRSRRSRLPTVSFSVGPTTYKATDGEASSKVEVEPFSETDLIILDYFRMWSLPPGRMKLGYLKTAGSTILRATGLYEEMPLIPATGYLFLQEMGVFAPWQNLHVLSEQLALPGHGISEEGDRIEEASNKYCENLGPETLVDSMKESRKDWGNLPVFCVDDVTAAEIDDGFSIEPVAGSDNTYWVHVHVANPSAFIPPDSVVAKRAEYLKSSFYSPERIYPMLPSSLVHDHFSLAPNRPVITFSAKVNTEGDILETNIVNGTVNNLIYITPNKVRKLFGIDRDAAPSLTICVGDEPPERTRAELQDYIPEEHQSTFYILEKLMAGRRQKRMDKGALEFAFRQQPQPRIQSNKDLDIFYSVNNAGGYHYNADPAIRLSGLMRDPFQPMDSTKEDLVSHVMLLGGEVAGLWAKDHEVPLIFSGTWHHPEFTPVTGNNVPNEGTESIHLGLPRSFATSKPTPHTGLGMDQYVKATSPLRRYSDLLAHWQIEAVLRQQASGTTSLDQIATSLPFTEAEIDKHIARANWQISLKNRAQNRSREFWICQALFRAFYFKQAALPATFQCLIRAPYHDVTTRAHGLDRDEYHGTMLPFDMACLVTSEKTSADIQAGDLVDVELVSIDMYTLQVSVKFSRHVKRPANGIILENGAFL